MEVINQVIVFFKSAQVSAGVVAIGLCVEAFLGATDLVKAGSTLELVLNGVKKVIGFIKGIIGPKA